jgi:hypothetical protein
MRLMSSDCVFLIGLKQRTQEQQQDRNADRAAPQSDYATTAQTLAR